MANEKNVTGEEPSSMDHLLKNSFESSCQQTQDKGVMPKTTYHHTIGGYKVRRINSSSNCNSLESSPEKWYVYLHCKEVNSTLHLLSRRLHGR